MTESGKTGLIVHVSRFDFSPRTQSYMDKLSDFTIKIGESGWPLLAAFPKPSGDPYMWCGALMELWSTWRWLYVAAQLRGVE